MKLLLSPILGALLFVGAAATEKRNVRSLLSTIPFSCDTCDAGYSDGCNSCNCENGQEVDCTDHVCVWQGIPSCLCDNEKKRCPSGDILTKDPRNGCQFPECPRDVFCTDDVKQCPDGSYVSRDDKNNCEFFPCPSQCCKDRMPSDIECGRSGCHCCSDGEWLLGNSGPTVTSEVACKRLDLEPSKPCEPVGCARDVMVCPDGSYVSRNLDLGCEFDPCPVVEPKCCADPKPSDRECGRSGCHCCSDGEWLLGNSGPTLSQERACGQVRLLPAKPCPPTCLRCESNTWTDGCNRCWCSDGEPACTKRFCDPSQLLPEPRCL